MTRKLLLTLALALAPLATAAQPASQEPTAIRRPSVEACPAIARERLERVARTAGASSEPDVVRRLERVRAQVLNSDDVALMLRCVMLRLDASER